MPRAASSIAHRVWSRDSNDAQQLSDQTASVAAAIRAYVPTHSFRRDVLAFCRIVGVTPHPKLVPMHADEEESLGADSAVPNANVYDLSETESVSVKHWQLDHGNCHGLCFALPLCAKIHSLCLFNVMLDRAQLELVCRTIPTTDVQVLQLEWNASNSHKTDSQCPSPGTLQSETLTVADTPKNDDEDSSAVYALLLATDSPLVVLSLRANGITAHGAAALANALQTNATLQRLNLFQNDIGDTGAVAIALALPNNTALTSLSLADNGISGTGALALAGAITRYEAPPALLKMIEDAESKIQAEIDHAKKAKKKIDRRTAMTNLGLPLLDVVDGKQFAPGNAVLEELVLSGNCAIGDADARALSDALHAFAPKLQRHLRHIKLERIPALRALHQRGHKLSDFVMV